MEKKKSIKIELNKKYYYFAIISLTALVIIMGFFSLLIGQYGFSISKTLAILFNPSNHKEEFDTLKNIIVNIRLPRTAASIVIGAGLAVAGATYQSVFRNTLVSQDVLGVSSGSCVGAALAIVIGASQIIIQLFSFLFGIITVLLVFILSKLVKSERTISMILSGMLIGGLMSSILSIIKYLANPITHLPEITFWLMGDVSSISIQQFIPTGIVICICIVLILIRKWNLNYFCYSDDEAKSLGVNIIFERAYFLITSTIIVAASIFIAGTIGWIGLVMPHLARLIVGTNNKKVIPTSMLMGSMFLLVIDLMNRLISSAELPVSILTGILGTPLFVFCLIYNRYKKKGEIR